MIRTLPRIQSCVENYSWNVWRVTANTCAFQLISAISTTKSRRLPTLATTRVHQSYYVPFCFPFFSRWSASVHSYMAYWPYSHHGRCYHKLCTYKPGSLHGSGTYRRHTPCAGLASARRVQIGEGGWAVALVELPACPVWVCVCVCVCVCVWCKGMCVHWFVQHVYL